MEKGVVLKFLVDEGISPKVVRFIRELGYEAVRPKELGLMGSSDTTLSEYTLKNDMIIVTLDMLFAYKHYFINRGKQGFILIRLDRPTTDNIIGSLKLLFDKIDTENIDIEKKLSIIRETEFEIIE